MAILNYTTKVPVEKTIAEITQKLQKAGAHRITMEYDQALQFNVAIIFTLVHLNTPITFCMNCNFEGVREALRKLKGRRTLTKADHESLIAQSKRVAWRIQKDWLEVQLALVEAELATVVDVFLSMAVAKNGLTLSQMMKGEGGLKLLDNSH